MSLTGKPARHRAHAAHAAFARSAHDGRSVGHAGTPFIDATGAARGRADRLLAESAIDEGEIDQIAPHMIGGWS